MKTEKYIQKQINETLEITSLISEVKVSHQFKEKVMHKLFQEERTELFSWFTTKLQYATLAMVILINSLAIYYITNSNYNSKIKSFAESFNISTKESITIK